VSRFRAAGIARAAIVFGTLSALPFGIGAHWVMNLFVFTLMYGALASAWNLVGGHSGYISLGHAAFFGTGAYALGIAVQHAGIGSGYRRFELLPLVGLGVAVASVPIGWVAFRTRGATFAIVTITLLFVVQQLAFNLRGLTGGSQGLTFPIPRFPVATYERPFYFAMLAVFALAVLLDWYGRSSKLGLALRAIRDDEDRARGLGVQTTFAKLTVFALSEGLAAMAGGVWAYYIAFIYPQFAVDPLVTIGMVLMVYLGGRGTLWGPVLGAFILVPAQQYLAYRLGASQLYLVGYSGVFLVVMLALPRGILPSIGEFLRRRRARGRRTKLAEVAS
jgi:branched-chain amino acid transport system permease protein